MDKIKLSQSYLMGLYNTPSTELPTTDLAKRINDDCGSNLTPKQVQHLFNVQLNQPLKNRPRKANGGNVEIVFDLDVVEEPMPEAAEYNEVYNNTNVYA